MLLIDNSNILNISYAIFVKTLKEKNGLDYVIKKEDLGMFFHLYVRKIKDYLATYDNIIFCGEGHNSTGWRKEKYPLYKENRKARGDNPDYAFIKDCYVAVDELLKLFPCCSLRTDNCEADDEIYALSKYFAEKGEQVNIVSSDRDLSQIMNYFDGITVYNPVKKEHMKADENILFEKAIIGDSSDNIKGLPRVGQKKFEKMMSSKEEWDKVLLKEENRKIYDTIMDIVDLRKYPAEYQKAIIDNFEKTGYNKLDVEGVEKFFFDNNLNQCQKSWSEWAGEIQMAHNGKAEVSAEDEIMEILNS